MGLTPDWIIQVTAFKIFQLDPPTPEQPFIRGLLDPCTNSMLAPNIPAEKLYDKVVGPSQASQHISCLCSHACTYSISLHAWHQVIQTGPKPGSQQSKWRWSLDSA